MEAFWVSVGVIALGEMGDKTQLLAVMLAARFRRPLPIVAGILVATVANHVAAGLLGGWIAATLGTQALRWVIGGLFLAMAAWMLVPDRMEADPTASGRLGVFGTAVMTFFLAEMGDKTQIATVALAARYHDLVAVVAGSTMGILLADVPAVWIGQSLVRKLPMRALHASCALVFALLGVLTLTNVASWP